MQWFLVYFYYIWKAGRWSYSTHAFSQRQQHPLWGQTECNQEASHPSNFLYQWQQQNQLTHLLQLSCTLAGSLIGNKKAMSWIRHSSMECIISQDNITNVPKPVWLSDYLRCLKKRVFLWNRFVCAHFIMLCHNWEYKCTIEIELQEIVSPSKVTIS